MRLLYIYFKTRGGRHALDGLDLNFDSSFRFAMKERILTCQKGTSLPPGFFSASSKVESVSAIVGANGAGKTAVARVLSSLILGSADYVEWCIVAICDDRYVCANSMGLKAVQGLRCDFVSQIPDDWRLVYISNHFSEKIQVETDGRRVLDYSTTGLIHKQASKRLDWGVHSGSVRYGVIGLYTSNQYIWILKFLASLNKLGYAEKLLENTGVQFPLSVKVSVNQELLDTNYALFCDRIREFERERNDNMRITERILQCARSISLFTGAFINIVGEYMRTRGMDSDNVEDDDLAKMLLRMADSLFCVPDEGEYMVGEYPKWNLYGLRETRFVDQDISEEGMKRRVLSHMGRLCRTGIETGHTKIRRFLIRLNLFANKYRTREDEARISLMDASAVSELVELMEELPLSSGAECPISFEIEPGMSSGELAYLMLWGRLYDAVTADAMRGKHTIFFFDEAETTLHPDWQRRLISNLLWMFENIAPGVSAHLIMASHSPILLSDIPKGNVLFLFDSKDKLRRSRQVREIRKLKDTFGANIFDLLRLSFFLEEGTVGGFAQKKIDGLTQKIFDKVSKKTETSEGITEEDRAVSRLVGDEIVNRYLQGWLKSLDSLC